VQVACREDERRVVLDDRLVAREAALVGAGRLIGEPETAGASGAPDGVEDRVRLTAHHIDPVGLDGVDVARGGRARGHEVASKLIVFWPGRVRTGPKRK
jgi:hypothetical protein